MFKEIFALVDWKDVWKRTLKTAWQAALGVFSAAVPTIAAATKDTWKAVLLGLIASGVSTIACAVWNGVFAPLIEAWKQSLED